MVLYEKFYFLADLSETAQTIPKAKKMSNF